MISYKYLYTLEKEKKRFRYEQSWNYCTYMYNICKGRMSTVIGVEKKGTLNKFLI